MPVADPGDGRHERPADTLEQRVCCAPDARRRLGLTAAGQECGTQVQGPGEPARIVELAVDRDCLANLCARLGEVAATEAKSGGERQQDAKAPLLASLAVSLDSFFEQRQCSLGVAAGKSHVTKHEERRAEVFGTGRHPGLLSQQSGLGKGARFEPVERVP